MSPAIRSPLAHPRSAKRFRVSESTRIASVCRTVSANPTEDRKQADNITDSLAIKYQTGVHCTNERASWTYILHGILGEAFKPITSGDNLHVPARVVGDFLYRSPDEGSHCFGWMETLLCAGSARPFIERSHRIVATRVVHDDIERRAISTTETRCILEKPRKVHIPKPLNTKKTSEMSRNAYNSITTHLGLVIFAHEIVEIVVFVVDMCISHRFREGIPDTWLQRRFPRGCNLWPRYFCVNLVGFPGILRKIGQPASASATITSCNLKIQRLSSMGLPCRTHHIRALLPSRIIDESGSVGCIEYFGAHTICTIRFLGWCKILERLFVSEFGGAQFDYGDVRSYLVYTRIMPELRTSYSPPFLLTAASCKTTLRGRTGDY